MVAPVTAWLRVRCSVEAQGSLVVGSRVDRCRCAVATASSPRSLKMPGYTTSPLQYPSFPFVSPLPKGSLIQTFRFQPRRDNIDWRRISAIDVEKVARELDISTLQESINAVTFCNLDNERCPYCQQPVDPVLLKVLKLAQLTIEYLLQCQECLSSTVVQLEERVQDVISEQQQTKDEVAKLNEELKKVKDENKRRKKLIGTQQMLLQAGANNYHKCQLCDKSFMNYSYLQGHLQRRHPEVTELERQKKKQVEQMEDGIEELKYKLQKTQAQLEEERETEQRRRMKELEENRQREETIKKEFEKWKEEERTKLQSEMDKLRQQLFSQIEDITLKNTIKFQEMESKKSTSSNLGELLDEEDRQDRLKLQKEMWNLKEEVERQEATWKQKMKEIKREHKSERSELVNENNRLRASLSNDQRARDEQFETTMQTLKSTVQKQKELIKSQEQKIRDLTSSKTVSEPMEVPQVAQLVVPVGNTKDESSEDELDMSLDQTMKRIEALRRNPEFIRQFRPILKQTLIEKLESMGVKKGEKGISSPTYKDLKALLAKQQQLKLKKFADLESLKARLSKILTKRLKKQRKIEETLQTTTSNLSLQSPRTTNSIPRSEPTTRVQNVQMVESIAMVKPVPSPRTKGMASQNAARITNVAPQPLPRTPPFTSEEETSVAYHSPNIYPVRKDNQNAQAVTAVQKKIQEDSDDDDDWSDSEISPGKPSPRVVSFSKDTMNQGSLVHSMARSIERQLSMQRERPVGGVETIPSTLIKSTSTKELQKSQSWDDSDSEFSSFEEITDLSSKKPQPAVRQSADSTGSHGTSIWSSASGKGW